MAVPSLRSYLDPQAWSQTDPRRSHETHRRAALCSGRWSPASWSGDQLFGARSADIQHLMVVTRWPGTRPFHAAVTSRLIAIAHRARVHACLLKTSLETHEPLVCVCQRRAGGSRRKFIDPPWLPSHRPSANSSSASCRHSGTCAPRANHPSRSRRVVPLIVSPNVTPLHCHYMLASSFRSNRAMFASDLAAPASSSSSENFREATLAFQILMTSLRNPRSQMIASSVASFGACDAFPCVIYSFIRSRICSYSTL